MKAKIIGIITALAVLGTLPAMSWTFTFDYWANSSLNATIPNQPFIQSLAITSVDLNQYYFANNTIAMPKTSIDDIADLQPLFYYNNASGEDCTVYLNSTGAEGLGTVCEVYIKPTNGLTQKLTPNILQNFGRPANNTAYFVAVKYLQQNGRCKFNLEVAQ